MRCFSPLQSVKIISGVPQFILKRRKRKRQKGDINKKEKETKNSPLSHFSPFSLFSSPLQTSFSTNSSKEKPSEMAIEEDKAVTSSTSTSEKEGELGIL